MPHWSENGRRLQIQCTTLHRTNQLPEMASGVSDVCIVILPASQRHAYRLTGIHDLMSVVPTHLGDDATLVVIGEAVDLVSVHESVHASMRYQHWISLKRQSVRASDRQGSLAEHHYGALIYTKYDSPLRHTKTRTPYTYCPCCDKTTKDYGGKKHTYHQYGTLLSDVWRDTPSNLDEDLTQVIDRFADLFGIGSYSSLHVLDCTQLEWGRTPVSSSWPAPGTQALTSTSGNIDPDQLIRGDCLEELRRLPDSSVDFAFADPPYNLGKHYTGYHDDMAVAKYFSWCDRWIAELARVLRPGRTCAVLNIPLWAIRHFTYMETVLTFQNWIVWDALAFPVRLIMPAHYAILCFAKGQPRALPGLMRDCGDEDEYPFTNATGVLEPLAEGFCLRAACMRGRKQARIGDRGILTDLWWDIHRLKHNTRRVDHPCQLPPQLMYRLISLFTRPEEVVLDCFNGAGTTTLAAAQLHRTYVGIELSEEYHSIATARHAELRSGMDPFRKAVRPLTAKNSPVPRMPKQKYTVSKKTLQLDVKRIAALLGRLPNREEVIQHSQFPIEYYDQYFAGWGEVCAAARTTGMSESRIMSEAKPVSSQPPLFELRHLSSQQQ